MADKTMVTGYRLRFNNGAWEAWVVHDGALPGEPIRLDGWADDRSDNLISDDPMGLMQLAHAILTNAVEDDRSFDDIFRDAAGQDILRKFFEELILPIKNNRPDPSQTITREAVIAWERQEDNGLPGRLFGVRDSAGVRVRDVVDAVQDYAGAHPGVADMSVADVVGRLAPSQQALSQHTGELITQQVRGILFDLVEAGYLVGRFDSDDPVHSFGALRSVALRPRPPRDAAAR